MGSLSTLAGMWDSTRKHEVLKRLPDIMLKSLPGSNLPLLLLPRKSIVYSKRWICEIRKIFYCSFLVHLQNTKVKNIFFFLQALHKIKENSFRILSSSGNFISPD